MNLLRAFFDNFSILYRFEWQFQKTYIIWANEGRYYELNSAAGDIHSSINSINAFQQSGFSLSFNYIFNSMDI